MKLHTKIYLTAFGFDLSDQTQYVRSELSNQRGVDIHHIVDRENRIENLMMLTRQEHLKYGEIKEAMFFLLDTHKDYLDAHSIPYNSEWFEKQMTKYEL
jgi:hypothetical protein